MLIVPPRQVRYSAPDIVGIRGSGSKESAMKFSDIIDQASALLQSKGRLTYRSLKLEFALDDEQLDVLKEELIDGQRVAVDENGKVLVWVGEGGKGETAKRGKGEEGLASSVQRL